VELVDRGDHQLRGRRCLKMDRSYSLIFKIIDPQEFCHWQREPIGGFGAKWGFLQVPPKRCSTVKMRLFAPLDWPCAGHTAH